MKVKQEPEKASALLNLLTEARAEADGLRSRVEKLEQVILSTRLMMGHELKKPATAISGYLELALEDIENCSRDELEEFIEKARHECLLLNDLNAFFLELLKTDERDDVLRGTNVNLRDFFDEVVTHIPATLDPKNRIKSRLSPDIRNFHTNANAFKIILANIVENALLYSPRDSEVLVDIRRTPDKRGMKDRDLVRIKVTDRGPGIPSEHIKRIFDPFVRLDEDAADGSGLGLTLVRSLAELYGGHVYIESEAGEGTTVHVTLPEVTDVRSRGKS